MPTTVLAGMLQSAVTAAARQMPIRVNTRDLSRHTTQVLGTLKQSGGSAVITHRGVPSFILVPIAVDVLPELLLSSAHELTEADLSSAREIIHGDKVTLGPDRP